MYKFFGYLNIALLVVVLSPYCARKINQWFIHSKSPGFQKLMKTLRALHKPAALLLLASIAAHWWLAWGSLRPHTGSLALISFVLTMLFGLLFYLLHKPPLLKIHRALALASILLVAVHLLFPSLLSQL